MIKNIALILMILCGCLGVQARASFDKSVFLAPAYTDTVKMSYAYVNKGEAVDVKVKLLPDGNEASISFSLNYDPAYLTPVSWNLGANAQPDAVLNVNPNYINAGYFAVLIDSLQTFGTVQESEWAVIRFQVNQPGRTNIRFADFPATRGICTQYGALYTTNWVDLTIGSKRF